MKKRNHLHHSAITIIVYLPKQFINLLQLYKFVNQPFSFAIKQELIRYNSIINSKK